jgi:hypothetical protein
VSDLKLHVGGRPGRHKIFYYLKATDFTSLFRAQMS